MIDAIKRYVADADSLRRDLGLLIRDIEDQQENNWTIRYAVDFAELYAYVMPEMRERFRIFYDDDDQLDGIVQDNALKRILFSENQAILVAPYFLEFDAFIDQVPSLALSGAAISAPALVAEAKRLSERPDFEAAKAAVSRLARDQKDIDLETVSEFITAHPGFLAQLKSFDPASPQERLSRLLTSDRFAELDALVGEAVMPQADVFEHWFVTMQKRRQEKTLASNRLDALAVALLTAANERLAARRIKLRLVTRSRTMNDVMLAQMSESGWRGDSLIRHPRCFAVFRNFELESMQLLKQLLGSVDAFLEACRQRQTASQVRGAVRLEDTDSLVLRKLRRLKEEWRTALELVSITLPPEPSRFKIQRVRDLLNVITSVSRVGALRVLLEHQIADLSEHVTKGHQFLGVLALGQVQQTRRIFEEDIAPHFESNRMVLSATREMPYKVQFYSEELRHWPAIGQKRHEWAEMLTFFERALASEAGDYEVLLTFAYFFCITANWSVAERYCNLSLGEKGADHPHEGLFLLAYVLRRQKADPERYQRALELLEAAIEQKKKRRNDPDLEDPRYFKEKAVVVQLWWRAHRDAVGDEFPPPPISEADALTLYERVLAHPEADDDLKAQVYNNLAMQLLMRGGQVPRKEVSDYLDRLEQLKPQDERRRWSALIDDTLIWGRWKTCAEPTRDYVETSMKELMRIQRSKGITSDERKRIREHLEEMNRSLLSAV